MIKFISNTQTHECEKWSNTIYHSHSKSKGNKIAKCVFEIEKQKHHSNWPTSNEGCCDDHFDALLENVYTIIHS